MSIEATGEVTPDDPYRIIGDLDGDGEITSSDALFVLRVSVGIENEDERIKSVSDVDSDSQITSSDALAILRHSVGMGENDKIGKTAV